MTNTRYVVFVKESGSDIEYTWFAFGSRYLALAALERGVRVNGIVRFKGEEEGIFTFKQMKKLGLMH